MPIRKSLNHNFFKKWTPEMAYVLGFFTADGNMMRNKRGAHFIDLYITDQDILVKIKKLLKSEHKIAIRDRRKINPNSKIGYRLQIGSKVMFNDLIRLGLMPNKSKVIKMPHVPRKYLSHFVRGYFDGDGHVSTSEYQKKDRKHKSRIIITGFTSGSINFLEGLNSILHKFSNIKGGTLFEAGGYRLCFSTHDSLRLYNFMYTNDQQLFLERKKSIFEYYFKNAVVA